MNYTEYWNNIGSIGLKWNIENADKWTLDNVYDDGNWMDKNIMDGKSLCDLGCGSGRLFPLWEKHNMKVTGIEWSDVLYPLALNNAKKRGYRALKQDIRKNVGENGEKFDFIVTTNVLLHIPPIDIDRCFGNIVNAMGDKLMIVVWYDPKKIHRNYNQVSYESGNSFSHPYYELFNKYNLKILKEEIIVYWNDDNITNYAWLLKKGDCL